MKTYFSNNTIALFHHIKALNPSNLNFKMFSKTFKTFKPVFNIAGKKTNHNNNLQATGCDSRPYSERRLDAILCEQDVVQGFKDRRLRVKDDSRPYRERRLDARLCEQDVAQGFKDRRLREIVIDMSVPVHLIAPALGQIARPITSHRQATSSSSSDSSSSSSSEQAQRQNNAEKKMKRFEEEQKQKKRIEEEQPVKNRLQVVIVKNPEMVLKMAHWFRTDCDITDEFYKDHIQFIRDQIGFAQDLQVDDAKTSECQIRYDMNQTQQPRRRQRIVLV